MMKHNNCLFHLNVRLRCPNVITKSQNGPAHECSRVVRSPSLTTCSQKQITPLYLVGRFLAIIFIIGLNRNGSFLLVLPIDISLRYDARRDDATPTRRFSRPFIFTMELPLMMTLMLSFSIDIKDYFKHIFFCNEQKYLNSRTIYI